MSQIPGGSMFLSVYVNSHGPRCKLPRVFWTISKAGGTAAGSYCWCLLLPMTKHEPFASMHWQKTAAAGSSSCWVDVFSPLLLLLLAWNLRTPRAGWESASCPIPHHLFWLSATTMWKKHGAQRYQIKWQLIFIYLFVTFIFCLIFRVQSGICVSLPSHFSRNKPIG